MNDALIREFWRYQDHDVSVTLLDSQGEVLIHRETFDSLLWSRGARELAVQPFLPRAERLGLYAAIAATVRTERAIPEWDKSSTLDEWMRQSQLQRLQKRPVISYFNDDGSVTYLFGNYSCLHGERVCDTPEGRFQIRAVAGPRATVEIPFDSAAWRTPILQSDGSRSPWSPLPNDLVESFSRCTPEAQGAA